ncbi:MAG TPA: CAP domain-containing protein [Solirubrobacteraceae bacterium]
MFVVEATDAGKVLRLRSMLAGPALAICLCAPAGAATTHHKTDQPTAGHHKGHRANRRHTHRTVRCAKRSSFHSSGGHVRHKHHPASCSKRRSGGRHAAGRAPAGSLHSKQGGGNGHHAGRHGSSTGKPATAPCPGADVQPTQANIEAIRAVTLCLINQTRTDHGEQPLQPNAHLEQTAQAHTESMAFGDYFEHNGPGGDTPLSRMTAAGYIYSSQVGYEIGENIGWGTLSLSTPSAIVAAWMASPGHRANILDAHFRDTAIGVSAHPPASLAQGQAGAIYTQDFGVIVTG